MDAWLVEHYKQHRVGFPPNISMFVIARPEEITVGDVQSITLHPPLEFLQGYLAVVRFGIPVSRHEITGMVEFADFVGFHLPYNHRKFLDPLDVRGIKIDDGESALSEKNSLLS